MKTFKKSLILMASVLGIFALTACSSNEEKGGAQEGDTISINIAYGNQPDEPLGQQAEKWKELAEEKSDGKLELNLYPSSQLGSEKDVVEQAISGNNVIVFTGYDYLMDSVPDAGILTAPYLVDDYDDLLYLTTTDWFDDLRGELESQGIDVINTTTIYGTRHLMTNKPVTSLDDLKGMKIRVPNNQMYIKSFEALGASPTPMPLGDLYTSLQQDLIDGAENPLPVLSGSKTQEVSKNLTLTSHTKIISPWIAGTDFMESVPEDLRDILIETGDEAAEFGREVMEEETEEVLEEFKSDGVEVHEIDLDEFKEATQKVYSEFPDWSPDLYEEVQEVIEGRE